MKKILTIFVVFGVFVSQIFAANLDSIKAPESLGAASCAVEAYNSILKVAKKAQFIILGIRGQMELYVIPNAKTSLEKTKKETQILEQLVATHQGISLQQEELIFNLEKKIQMRK